MKNKFIKQRKIDQAEQAVFKLIKEQRSIYAKKWGNNNAQKFEEDGHYDWMAESVRSCELILEIGTGTGQGTNSLLNNGHTVISIDENPFCLELAKVNLENSEKQVIYESREKIILGDYGYNIEYSFPMQNFTKNGVLLLEGDVLNDPNLIKWLSEIKKVDAIVCWLIGTHDARAGNNIIISKKVHNSHQYRLRVQNNVYDLADKILRQGGLLNIVDRGEEPKEKFLQDDIIRAHKDQASTTNLEFQSLDWRLYEESEETKKIPMILSPGLSGRVPTECQPALISITFRKP